MVIEQIVTAEEVVARYDFLLTSGVRPDDIWRAVRVSKRQIDELRYRATDLDPSVAARIGAKLTEVRVKDSLTRQIGQKLSYGWVHEALARQLKVTEAELDELKAGTLDLDDHEAAELLGRLSWSKWSGLTGLRLSVKEYLAMGFTPEALGAWLDRDDNSVSRLLDGTLDLTDDEIIVARQKLSDIPVAKVVNRATGELVVGPAFDQESAELDGEWWIAFDDGEAAGGDDWTILSAFRDVTVRLAHQGRRVELRLLDDRDADRIKALIAERRAAADRESRRYELESLFPRATYYHDEGF